MASESDDSMSGVEDNRNTSNITLDTINENEVCKITIALLKLYLRAIEMARKRGTLPKYISTGQIHLFKKGKLVFVSLDLETSGENIGIDRISVLEIVGPK